MLLKLHVFYQWFLIYTSSCAGSWFRVFVLKFNTFNINDTQRGPTGYKVIKDQFWCSILGDKKTKIGHLCLENSYIWGNILILAGTKGCWKLFTIGYFWKVQNKYDGRRLNDKWIESYMYSSGELFLCSQESYFSVYMSRRAREYIRFLFLTRHNESIKDDLHTSS